MENKESHLMHAHLFLRPNIYIFFKIKAGQFQSGTLSIAVFHQIQTTTTTKRVWQNDSLPFDAALADCVYRLAARLKMLSLAGFCWQFVGGEFFRFSFPWVFGVIQVENKTHTHTLLFRCFRPLLLLPAASSDLLLLEGVGGGEGWGGVCGVEADGGRGVADVHAQRKHLHPIRRARIK